MQPSRHGRNGLGSLFHSAGRKLINGAQSWPWRILALATFGFVAKSLAGVCVWLSSRSVFIVTNRLPTASPCFSSVQNRTIEIAGCVDYLVRLRTTSLGRQCGRRRIRLSQPGRRKVPENQDRFVEERPLFGGGTSVRGRPS